VSLCKRTSIASNQRRLYSKDMSCSDTWWCGARTDAAPLLPHTLRTAWLWLPRSHAVAGTCALVDSTLYPGKLHQGWCTSVGAGTAACADGSACRHSEHTSFHLVAQTTALLRQGSGARQWLSPSHLGHMRSVSEWQALEAVILHVLHDDQKHMPNFCKACMALRPTCLDADVAADLLPAARHVTT
jgi:hypothetical protein